MTTQDFLDWALGHELDVHLKITLVALAMDAGPQGGGRITLGRLARRTSLTLLGSLGTVHRLVDHGLIVTHYAPRLYEPAAETSEVAFGLCLDRTATA